MNRAERFLVVVSVFVGIVVFLFTASILDRLDQYKTTATVISVERLDEQVVTFETEKGDIFVEYFDYEDTIEPQAKAVLSIKEYENMNPHDDRVVKVKWVE
jgi:predicted transcriptional regulator